MNWNGKLQKQSELVIKYIGTDIEECCRTILPYISPDFKVNGKIFRGFSIKKMIFGGMKLKKELELLNKTA